MEKAYDVVSDNDVHLYRFDSIKQDEPRKTVRLKDVTSFKDLSKIKKARDIKSASIIRQAGKSSKDLKVSSKLLEDRNTFKVPAEQMKRNEVLMGMSKTFNGKMSRNPRE